MQRWFSFALLVCVYVCVCVCVRVLTEAGELVLDPMAGKGESGVSRSTPLTKPA